MTNKVISINDLNIKNGFSNFVITFSSYAFHADSLKVYVISLPTYDEYKRVDKALNNYVMSSHSELSEIDMSSMKLALGVNRIDTYVFAKFPGVDSPLYLYENAVATGEFGHVRTMFCKFNRHSFKRFDGINMLDQFDDEMSGWSVLPDKFVKNNQIWIDALGGCVQWLQNLLVKFFQSAFD